MTTTASSVHSTAQSKDATDPQVTITESRLKVLLNQAAEQAAEHVLQKMIDTSNGDRRTRMMERTRSEPLRMSNATDTYTRGSSRMMTVSDRDEVS